MTRRVIRTSDVLNVEMAVPAGHQHLRTVLTLADGLELELQEATLAALVRAYVRIKTDPEIAALTLKGKALPQRKEGFAEWQLVED